MAISITLITKESSIGNTSLAIPLMPPEIRATKTATTQSYSLVSKGEVLVPKGTACDEFSWEGIFPGRSTANAFGKGTAGISDANYYVNLINSWMDNNVILTLVVAGTWINTDVTVSSFEATPTGGYGDIKYSITLRQYKTVRIYTTNDLNIESSNSKLVTKNAQRGSKSSLIGKTYKTKKGDSLYKIALMAYSDGAKWTKIWKVKSNQKALNKAAKKHGKKNSDKGRLVYPGTKLKIP